jgi:hypothetical protein
MKFQNLHEESIVVVLQMDVKQGTTMSSEKECAEQKDVLHIVVCISDEDSIFGSAILMEVALGSCRCR